MLVALPLDLSTIRLKDNSSTSNCDLYVKEKAKYIVDCLNGSRGCPEALLCIFEKKRIICNFDLGIALLFLEKERIIV